MSDIYSFQKSDNYKIALTNETEHIQNKYKEIIEQYLSFSIQQFSISNPSYKKYTIIRGIETVSHVFLFLLYYTKNIDFTCHHTEKSYYYFVEFMQQITEDKNIFLNLSSKDAIMYVYKKTIFEILNDKKNTMYTNEENKQFNQIKNFIHSYRCELLEKLEK